jgi:hypothetical protein
MTQFIIKLGDESKASLLLALLKRLAMSRVVDLSVEQNGQEVALDTMSDEEAQFEAVVNRIIENTIAGRSSRLGK